MKRIFEWHEISEESFDCGSFMSIIREQIEFVTDDFVMFTYPITNNEVIVTVEINKEMTDEEVDIRTQVIQKGLRLFWALLFFEL